MEEMNSLRPNKETEAYRIADERVREAIAGLYTADPPLDLPGLDSDRIAIIARLIRERDAVLAKRPGSRHEGERPLHNPSALGELTP